MQVRHDYYHYNTLIWIFNKGFDPENNYKHSIMIVYYQCILCVYIIMQRAYSHASY